MEWKDFIKLPEYHFAIIDRNRIRFTGIGPRLHDKPGQLWPRDYINVEEESKKILYADLERLIDNESLCDRLRHFLRDIFTGLKRCNVNSIFNKYCALPSGHFDRVTFDVHYALDSYTRFKQILQFIHQLLRSVNLNGDKKIFELLFGSNKNHRIFRRHIKWLVTGNAKLRKLNAAHFVKWHDISMDLTKVEWLDGLNLEARYRVFLQVVSALSRFVQELLRRYFYITTGNPYSEMLIYFRYDLWQKIQLKCLKQLIEDKVLHPIAIENDLIDIPPLAASKIKLFLKRDGARLICTDIKGTRRYDYFKIRAVLSFVQGKTPNFRKFSLNTLLDGLRRFKKKIDEDGARVYFVKADIKDCFQSIQQDLLRSIVRNILDLELKGGPIELFKIKQIYERKGKSVFKWSMFRPEKEIEKSPGSIKLYEGKWSIPVNDFDNDYLRPLIMNPVLRESKDSKNGLNLIKGIRQGSPYSPIFCSIYIQTAFNQYIGEFLNSEDCQVFHWVDDILFLSTNLERANMFMKKMLLGFKHFGLVMNLDKFECNFNHPNSRQLPPLTDCVTFYKQKISVNSLQCRYNYSYEKIELQHTFRVSPYGEPECIESICERFKVDLIHFDVALNGVDGVVENIFERSALIAHRVATAFLISFKLRIKENQDPILLMKLIYDTVVKLYTKITAGRKENLIDTEFTYREIRLITTAAFLVTWQKVKLRHRSKELERLTNNYNRYKMRYLLSINSNDSRMINATNKPSLNLESKVNQLMKSFSSSSFAREIKLPSAQ